MIDRRQLLTGNQAAAWGARVSNIDYTPLFPITPQTEIMETLMKWIEWGYMDCGLATMESEHSMVTAAGAAAATGVRVFTATSSQGLLYAMEMLYNASGWRTPFVMVNVSRGLSAPITLEPDHNDVLAARDSGFILFHCATCQEVLDAILFSYRLGENPKVRLPVIVNMDGFYLSFTRETVILPNEYKAKIFVGNYDPMDTLFSAAAPSSQGIAVLGGGPYSYFRYQAHLASLNALSVFEEVSEEFHAAFGRKIEMVEGYRLEDAESALVMMGCFATKAKDAVDRMREAGWSVGLMRPCLLRPFPAEEIRRQLKNRRGVAVIDQNISPGKGGILHGEIVSALFGHGDLPSIVTSFIGGLGGRDIAFEEFREMVTVTQRAVKEKKMPPPRLLYTKKELEEVRRLQSVAVPVEISKGVKSGRDEN